MGKPLSDPALEPSSPRGQFGKLKEVLEPVDGLLDRFVYFLFSASTGLKKERQTLMADTDLRSMLSRAGAEDQTANSLSTLVPRVEDAVKLLQASSAVSPKLKQDLAAILHSAVTVVEQCAQPEFNRAEIYHNVSDAMAGLFNIFRYTITTGEKLYIYGFRDNNTQKVLPYYFDNREEAEARLAQLMQNFGMAGHNLTVTELEVTRAKVDQPMLPLAPPTPGLPPPLPSSVPNYTFPVTGATQAPPDMFPPPKKPAAPIVD